MAEQTVKGKQNTTPIPAAVARSRKPVSKKIYNSRPGTQILDRNQNDVAATIKDLRQLDPFVVIKSLIKTNGPFSKAVWGFIQIAMSGYKIYCRDAITHKIDPEATIALRTVLTSANNINDYTKGFSYKLSIDGVLECLLKDILVTGSCAMELVVNTEYLPENIIPLPSTELRWYNKANGVYPQQVNRSGDGPALISLDIPTVFVASAQQDSSQFKATSPLQPALQMLFVFTEFVEDVARVVRSAGHSRLVVRLVVDKILRTVPDNIKEDPDKLASHLESIRTSVSDVVSNLNPEDALVLYDTADEPIALKTSGEKADYATLTETLGALLASSLKSMPSVLGLSSAGSSQNAATMESLIYLKIAAALQTPVQTVMSRLLTLAVRLYTEKHVYAEFVFNPIDLRPENELAAHKATMLNMALGLLSYGLIDDSEFSVMNNLPFHDKQLSGSGFYTATATPTTNSPGQPPPGQVKEVQPGTSQGPPKPNPSGKQK